MEKDVPFLQKALPRKFKAAYMKGRSNYACLYRIHKADHQPILDGLDQMGHFKRISEWSRETKTGDRRELDDLPEDLSFWSRINAKGETCIGQKCPDFEPCFITRMRSNAESADIIVVNHHLFFADLSVRGNQFGKVIPDYGAVIFDEAHLLEDLAADVQEDEDEELRFGATTLPRWAKFVIGQAAAALQHAINSLRGTARELKAVSFAETEFNKQMGIVKKNFPNLFPKGEPQ